ncbi:MAG TPA: hypothetical protein VLG50_02940 [Candidatus Saccharimonadales bacterium]|nr:hypothetical protein [Candidatus Saccharimonadales bacterium]
MKKLLLAVTAIACIYGSIQASWASSARLGVVTLVANTPLMYTVWSHKVESARIGQDVVNSIQAATAAGSAVAQRIEGATAKLNEFTPIMQLSALQDRSSMGWTQWAATGTGNFLSHVFTTVLTTLAIQLLMHTAINTMQNVATSMIEQEATPEIKNVAPVQVQVKPNVIPVKK